METLPPISKRVSLLLRKSHKRPHLSVGYFTKKEDICQGFFRRTVKASGWIDGKVRGNDFAVESYGFDSTSAKWG